MENHVELRTFVSICDQKAICTNNKNSSHCQPCPHGDRWRLTTPISYPEIGTLKYPENLDNLMSRLATPKYYAGFHTSVWIPDQIKSVTCHMLRCKLV